MSITAIQQKAAINNINNNIVVGSITVLTAAADTNITMEQMTLLLNAKSPVVWYWKQKTKDDYWKQTIKVKKTVTFKQLKTSEEDEMEADHDIIKEDELKEGDQIRADQHTTAADQSKAVDQKKRDDYIKVDDQMKADD